MTHDFDDFPRYQKKANRAHKRFGIEWFNPLFKRWHVWHWYVTEQRRDQGLACLNRSTVAGFKYRKIDRD